MPRAPESGIGRLIRQLTHTSPRESERFRQRGGESQASVFWIGVGSLGSPKRVLLVEDNADVADMLTAYLQHLGHEVIQAHDGPAGLDAPLRHWPEVIVCDIGLPGLDGYEIPRRVRESPGPQPCAMIAVSGYGASTDRERARAAGFDHHLTKPADPVQLADLIARTSKGDRRGQ